MRGRYRDRESEREGGRRERWGEGDGVREIDACKRMRDKERERERER